MVYVLPAFSRARHAIILCQFPHDRHPPTRHRGLEAVARWLAVAPEAWLRGRVLSGGIDDFDQLICRSEYSGRGVRRLWQRDCVVINPPIDEPDWSAKRNVILTVSRFVAGGHNKKHHLMMQAFVSCATEACEAGSCTSRAPSTGRPRRTLTTSSV